MARRTLRGVLTVVITVLILAAMVLAIRQVIVFSGQIASQSWALAFNMGAKRLVFPFGFSAIRTPYHGVFDVNNAVTLLLVLGVEWAVSMLRDRA